MAAVNFKKFGPFVNFARVELGAVENTYKGLTITGQKIPAVSFLTGGVFSCNLVVPKLSTREGAADTKCISIIPILVEYERYISYIGLKIGSSAMHGPIFDSTYLTFSTRKESKDGGSSEASVKSPFPFLEFYKSNAFPLMFLYRRTWSSYSFRQEQIFC